MNKCAEKLADLIEKNPGSHFDIDNDFWDMQDSNGKHLEDSTSLYWQTDFYGSSSSYGAGIAEALIVLLNRRGFSITADAL